MVRDAALKLAGAAPNSSVNREYFAQNNEKAIEDGIGLEEYEKQDEKGRALLKKLANSAPYQRKRKLDALEGDRGGSEMSGINESAQLSQSEAGLLRSSYGKDGQKGQSDNGDMGQNRNFKPPT